MQTWIVDLTAEWHGFGPTGIRHDSQVIVNAETEEEARTKAQEIVANDDVWGHHFKKSSDWKVNYIYLHSTEDHIVSFNTETW